ncbi:MAG: chromosome segregation protein SMC, partial [Bdellovibrionales bacterium]|nr:chromosome segregation protein SMC [Bdellovibrionales bacterium]
MRVKRLEIQGFKSFKDKTVVHFDRRITGVVGPNGCGKSNIVDAFFWVMGEQSYKHLRGKGSSDLIFSGSSKYNQAGVAEATLVLETDYVETDREPSGASANDLPVYLRSKEVSVTRRVFRTGEGEYFINGLPARLKDIQELFMDTGVGAKGYSVIEQGQIDRVVNAKPEERRKLIEEAAGIAKYKARKKESLRKMEAAQANLARLNDVLAEIERSLGSLERQAQKARKYKEYKDELFEKEMTWGRRKALALRLRHEALRKEKDALEIELLALRAELSIAENDLESGRAVQLTEGKQAEDLQTAIQTLSTALTQEQSSLELSRQRQSDLSERITSLTAEREELSAAIEEDRGLAEARSEEYEALEGRFSEIDARVREQDACTQQARSEAARVRQELDALKRRLMDDVNRASHLTSQVARVEAQREGARENLERVTGRDSEIADRVLGVEAQLGERREQLEVCAARRDELRSQASEAASRIRVLESAQRQSEKDRNESNRALMQLRSRLESLEELAASREGLGDGPKSVLEWARTQGRDANFALVADCLKVSRGFEEVLEGFLETRLETLAAEDARAAIAAFGALREKKRGRASFEFAVAAGSSETRGRAGFAAVSAALGAAGLTVLGELSEFVGVSGKQGGTIAERAEAGARALISGVAVVESLENAETLTQAAPGGLDGWAIVSRDGTVLENRGGMAWTLRGGSTQSDQSASILGRKRAIEELTEAVSQAEARLAASETVLAEAVGSLEEARSVEQTLRARVQETEVDHAVADREVRQLARAEEEAKAEFSRVKIERARIEETLARLEAERTQAQADLGAITEGRGELEDSVSSGSAQLEARELTLRDQESALQEVRIQEAAMRERVQSLRREIEAARQLAQTRERRLDEVKQILERCGRDREQFSGGDGGKQSRIEELSIELSQRREALSILRDRLEQSGSTVTSALDRIKSLHEEGDRRTARTNETSLLLEKSASDLQYLVQNLEEKYGPGCLERPAPAPIQEEMTEPVITADMSEEEQKLLEEEVERLRERIRRLGEVNTMAIEEFEELKKRFDHLQHEREDLLKSVDNLQEAIEHINRTSEKRFQVAFEAIAQRFEKLFPIIFGGGRAELSLVPIEGAEPGNVLDMGVDIMAQPPGKKIASIGVLSGGEKALTAISLVFAIFMVKPSPFCLLDDVYAPLDDNNIWKFNALLREMSAKTQFIIITHNKKTMELNDTLYGVT